MLTEETLEVLLKPFGLAAPDCVHIGSSQNHVYSVPGPSIVRISVGRHRLKHEMDAELEWVNYLAAKGLHVCGPLRSSDGNLCEETLIDGEIFMTCRFQQAPGRKLAREEFTAEAYQELGRLVGEMHLASVEFHRDHAPLMRGPWERSRLLREDVEACGPTLTAEFRASIETSIGDILHIPQNEGNYGLIHADVSFGNCHFDECHAWIFDFDNSEYGYFLQDLATVLYDSIYCKVLNQVGDGELTSAVKPRWQAFLQGYRAVRELPAFTPEQLKDFFILREAVIHVHYHRVLDIPNVGPSFREGLELMRRNVEARTHQLDFSALV